MKKIICLLLAVCAMLVFVSCGECETHVDENKDGVCDECEASVELPGAAIFKMVAEAEPTVIATIASTTIDDVSYTSDYTTYIYSADSYKHEFNIERPAGPDDDSDSAVVKVPGVVEYAEGVYKLNGEIVAEAPVVEYLDVCNNINAENVTSFSVDKSGKTMTATLTKAQCKAIFGVEPDADNISLTITTNGVRLTKITLNYTRTSGVIVTSETSYSYAPHSTEGAE